MKFKVDRESILEGLQKVQSVVSSRTTLPVLSNVLLKAEANRIWFTTTNLEVSVRTGIDADVEEEGSTTLPVRRLFSIVRELDSAKLEFETDDKDITSIRSASSFFKVIGISDEEFPPLLELDAGQGYVLEQGVFKEMLRDTSYAASGDETRYILNGVFLSFKGEKLTIVATDGRRLALIEKEMEFPESSEVDLVVPSKTVDELVKNLGDQGSVNIKANANQISFEFDDLLVVSKLIEGTYPNYKQVIPSQCEERVPIEREALFTSVRRVAILTSDKSNSVKFNFGKNKLEITAITPEVGEAHETIPVKYDGKQISIAFNPEFVLDPLRNITSDEVYFELTDDLSPGVLKCDIPFLYVLMPMRVN
jgi:DNA polymerase-3 subunit beta